MTTRGFKVKEVTRVAEIMVEVLMKRTDAAVKKAKQEIKKLALAHPIPESFL
jgi:glycine/serine hydroxymethyltransferase